MRLDEKGSEVVSLSKIKEKLTLLRAINKLGLTLPRPSLLKPRSPFLVPKKVPFLKKKFDRRYFLIKRNVLLLLVLSPPNVFMRFRRLSRSVVVVFPFDVVFGFKIACILLTWPENPRVSQEFSENLFVFICTKILENIGKR